MKLRFLAAAVCGLGLSVPASAETLEAVLRLKERLPIEALARNVVDPASPRFRQFYSPAEIRALAGPADSAYQAVVLGLTARGLRVVAESPTHLLLTVSGDRAAFERTFGVRVQALAGGARSVSGALRVPAALAPVVSVVGLDNRRHSRPMLRLASALNAAGAGGVPLATIRTLYGFDALYAAGLSGRGQHIAIATYDDFNLSDVTDYYTQQGLSPAPTVDKVVFNGAPAVNENSAMETEVDAEFSGALAPQAMIHVFSSKTNDDAGELQMFTAILDDNRAKVVNYSWGDCESNLAAQHKADMAPVFARAVAQGVNIMVASGDSGSGCKDASGATKDPMADWPAAHPDVVAVGGSTLDTNAPMLSETAWSGSGGGVSTLWDLPVWQSGFDSPYTKRSYPDVAFNADPASGQAAYVQQFGIPMSVVIGGTSIAAPQWSAFMTLVGEARAQAGKQPLGALSPVIYAMTPAARATAFSDISSGSNGKYTAAAGWDAVTGFGSMHADALLGYLKAN